MNRYSFSRTRVESKRWLVDQDSAQARYINDRIRSTFSRNCTNHEKLVHNCVYIIRLLELLLDTHFERFDARFLMLTQTLKIWSVVLIMGKLALGPKLAFPCVLIEFANWFRCFLFATIFLGARVVSSSFWRTLVNGTRFCFAFWIRWSMPHLTTGPACRIFFTRISRTYLVVSTSTWRPLPFVSGFTIGISVPSPGFEPKSRS